MSVSWHKKIACSYSFGLFFNNTFKKKVELFEIKQSLSVLQVITCLDSIKKKKV